MLHVHRAVRNGGNHIRQSFRPDGLAEIIAFDAVDLRDRPRQDAGKGGIRQSAVDGFKSPDMTRASFLEGRKRRKVQAVKNILTRAIDIQNDHALEQRFFRDIGFQKAAEQILRQERSRDHGRQKEKDARQDQFRNFSPGRHHGNQRKTE